MLGNKAGKAEEGREEAGSQGTSSCCPIVSAEVLIWGSENSHEYSPKYPHGFHGAKGHTFQSEQQVRLVVGSREAG